MSNSGKHTSLPHTIFTVKKFYSAGPENSHNGLRKYLKEKSIFINTSTILIMTLLITTLLIIAMPKALNMGDIT